MISKLAGILSKKGLNAFIIHGNADPDALASAYAMSSVFGGSIVAPQGLDRGSKQIAEKLSISVDAEIEHEELDREQYDRLVVLDTSGPEQLGKLNYLGNNEQVIVIDHHTRNTNWASKTYYCDDSKSSCCEIVYEIISAAGRKPAKKVATALLAGMLTDSGHFRYGNHGTLVAFAGLMKSAGISMRDVLQLVEGEVDLSERISQLKGAQRLKYSRVERFVIATSFGSAFEASACKSLISLGADVAFVGSQRGDYFRISSRASSQAVDLGLHLGKLLDKIAADTSNGGGGHPGAAGLSGRGDVRKMLNLCVQHSRRKIRSLLSAKK